MGNGPRAEEKKKEKDGKAGLGRADRTLFTAMIVRFVHLELGETSNNLALNAALVFALLDLEVALVAPVLIP